MREFSFTVSKEEEGMAIKKILKRNFNFSSRLFARLKAQKRVFLNGIPLEGWMNPREGDRIVAIMPEEASHFPEEDIPVDPLYEDQDLLIINKPAGFTVHPTKGRPAHTMANGIQKYMRESGEKYKIRFVNRLDMDTSGILVIAKNSHAQDNMTGQMHTGEIHKYYQAIVIGNVEQDQFTIDLPIEKPDPDRPDRAIAPEGRGRRCITHVRVLKRFSKYTLVCLLLETGRTHQIRVHMSHIGHPVAGDNLYGGDRPWLIGRQALHACRIEFRHPAENRMLTIEAPLPEDMKKMLEKIE